jgi:hypothetical protein
MKEEFISYIWQHQLFNKDDLRTRSGLPVNVIHPGHINRNEGPDFRESKILVDGIEWYGSVEIHVKSSDWKKHRHNENRSYNQVILHVVWEEDEIIPGNDGSELHSLELIDRVDDKLIRKYEDITQNLHSIPCQSSISRIDRIHIRSEIEKQLIHRLERKSGKISDLCSGMSGDWEVTLLKALFRSFGFSVNSAGFNMLSEKVDWAILRKENERLLRIEAILFGLSGLIALAAKDEYQFKLKNEFSYLKRKHSLPNPLDSAIWRFSKLRPQNFPSFRIAQFAALIHRRSSFFSEILSQNDLKSLISLFKVSTHDYWADHYHFKSESKPHSTTLGIAGIHSIIINAVVPVIFAYAQETGNRTLKMKCLDILEELPAEKIGKLRIWSDLNLSPGNAFESQGLLELYSYGCLKRKCLNCRIGSHILSNSDAE